MFKKVAFSAIAILGFALLLYPYQSSALTLTPTYREVTLTPGEKSIATVTLENETSEAIQLTTEVAPFTAKGETGEPDFDFDASPSGLSSWIEVVSGLTLGAGESQDVDIVFNTAASAIPGGHYAAVFFNQVAQPETEDARDVMIESKIGTLFLATVDGAYTESGSIKEFSPTGASLTGGTPIDFTVRFENTGDVHSKPIGSIVINDMFGKTVETIEVNSEKGAVLPDTIREYMADSWTPSGTLIGKYTAKLTLTSGTISDSAVVDFWFFSTVGIVIIVAILLVLVLLVILLAKLVGKKKPEAPDEPQT